MVVTRRVIRISIFVLTVSIYLFLHFEMNEKILGKNIYSENSNTRYEGALQCDKILRPTKLDVRQAMWQVSRVKNTSENLVYSMQAYYDNRTSFQGKHSVRLFLVLHATSKHILQKGIYCYLWINKSIHPHWVHGKIIKDVPDSVKIIKNITYLNILLTCDIPSSLQYAVSHVSFSEELCGSIQVYLPVTYPQDTGTYEHQFGQCNANGILFGEMGDKDAYFMIEWIEMGLLFGIGEFNLYNGTMQASTSFQKVLSYYIGKGILRLYQQPPPIPNASVLDRIHAEFATRTGFHDCMYRNMYRYEYIVSIDLDEIIVPKEPYTSYHDIIGKIPSSKPYPTIMFPSIAFYRTLFGKSQEGKSEWNLTVSKYLKGVYDSRHKTFINPRLCIRANSHGCTASLQNVTSRSYFRAGKLAEVHHHRNKCVKNEHFTEKICRKGLKTSKENKLILRFITETFYQRIKSILKSLKM